MAGDANQVLGIASIQLAGDYYPSAENAKLTLGGVARKTFVGDQVHGYSETAKQSRLEARFPAQQAVSVAAINAFKGPITFQGDNGVTWVVPNAWCLGDAAVQATSGEISATFEGLAAQEQGAG